MLKLGIIGSSPGNGHPYSWSAIFNGYDPEAMATCPFPVIPQYLAERRFPEDSLQQGRVTHIWTQDPALSAHIAAASRISHVVNRLHDMIGEVDAILLARDDAETHETLATPFLEAGLPVYIDKPLALDRETAGRILARERFPGQLFSCTPLIYAQELALSQADHEALGRIRHVTAMTPKYWDTYAVHIIEPTLRYLGISQSPRRTITIASGDRRMLTATWDDQISASFTTTGSLPSRIEYQLFGERGMQQRVFIDSFSAFRAALKVFCDGIVSRRRMYDPLQLSVVTELIERGRAEA
jgi:hypothetical protein